MTSTLWRRVGERPQPLIRSLLLLAVAVGFASVNLQAQTTAPTSVTTPKPKGPNPPPGSGFAGPNPSNFLPQPGGPGLPGAFPSGTLLPPGFDKGPPPLSPALLLNLQGATGLAQAFSLPPIDPKTPAKDLLPPAPKIKRIAGPFVSDDLSLVPEVEFESALARDNPNQATQHIANQIARVNHLNNKKHDLFMETLRGERADLAGLPMAMGDACRTRGERSKQFTLAVNLVRNTNPAQAGDGFWYQYQAQCLNQDRDTSIDRSCREAMVQARIAALMQMLAPLPASMRLGLVKYLSTLAHVDATRAIAKLSIFSPEDEIRQAAVDALKVRKEKDYTDVLLQGLRYPLPAVARRASDMLVKLERTDVIPQLLNVLEEPDPRCRCSRKLTRKRHRWCASWCASIITAIACFAMHRETPATCLRKR